MKQDEHELLRACVAQAARNPENPNHPTYPFACDIARALNIPDKRWCYLLEKWPWWESGVSIGTGWFSDLAKAEAALKAADEAMLASHLKGQRP